MKKLICLCLCFCVAFGLYAQDIPKLNITINLSQISLMFNKNKEPDIRLASQINASSRTDDWKLLTGILFVTGLSLGGFFLFIVY